MSTTLNIESFSPANIKERTQLTAGVVEGATTLVVRSTAGYSAGDILYLGDLSREGCERVIIDSVPDSTTLTLTAPTTLAHLRFEPVTSVLGDKIRIYRAANVDGTTPADDQFTVLASRSIDADELSTYYTDSSGSSSYWYKFTYWNELTGAETDLDDSEAVRGDDFGHYASLSEIRKQAGFENALNLSDTVIDQQRRIAEAEINGALGGRYSVPFSPVPERIHALTIQLAAALLLANAYRGTNRGQEELKTARALIAAYQSGDQTLTDEDGAAITTGEGISSWPGEEQPRAFEMGMKF